MAVIVRHARQPDIASMNRVRARADAHLLTAGTQSNPASYEAFIETIGQGWVLEDDGVIVAFAIGERATGRIWSLHVLPEHADKGYEEQVLAPLIAWLFSHGLDHITMTTSGASPPSRFFGTSGWTKAGVDAGGHTQFALSRSHRHTESLAHTVAIADPCTPQAQALLARLSSALKEITGDCGSSSFDVADVQVEGACFCLAHDANGQPAGCGALRPLQDGVVELKRMFALPGSQGVGRKMLAFLEMKALELGYQEIWLETRKVNTRAVAFYQRNGYRVIDNFGKYIGRSDALCFGKRLSQTVAKSVSECA